jgi:hypothetical protein
MNPSLILAKHIANTDYDGLPHHVVEIIKKSFLDGLSVILAASSAKMLENMMVYEKKVGDDWDIYLHYFPEFLAIDIKPGDDTNSINLKGMKIISVAILSAADFDAPSDVDQATLSFGVTGDEASFKSFARKPKDVNGDGSKDLVC